MSGVQRQRKERFDSPIDCRLTARPVVLAKTYGPGSFLQRKLQGPGRTFFEAPGSFLTSGFLPLRNRFQARDSGDAGGF
jgi:hypothetical protein